MQQRPNAAQNEDETPEGPLVEQIDTSKLKNEIANQTRL